MLTREDLVKIANGEGPKTYEDVPCPLLGGEVRVVRLPLLDFFALQKVVAESLPREATDDERQSHTHEKAVRIASLCAVDPDGYPLFVGPLADVLRTAPQAAIEIANAALRVNGMGGGPRPTPAS